MLQAQSREAAVLNPLDPTDLPFNMRYFPRISPNSLKISPKLRANILIQSPTHPYLFIKTKKFLLYLKGNFIGFNLIYWTPICDKYFLEGSILEKCGKFRKNGCFSGRIWPDWGNTTWADMAGLGSIGLKCREQTVHTLTLTQCLFYIS